MPESKTKYMVGGISIFIILFCMSCILSCSSSVSAYFALSDESDDKSKEKDKEEKDGLFDKLKNKLPNSSSNPPSDWGCKVCNNKEVFYCSSLPDSAVLKDGKTTIKGDNPDGSTNSRYRLAQYDAVEPSYTSGTNKYWWRRGGKAEGC